MLCPQGTPIFTARAVVSCKQRSGDYTLEAMPQLDQENGAYKAYEAAVRDRLRAFPPNAKGHYEIPSDKELKPFKHKLQYDAESVFWLLLYWAIRACPADDTSPASKKIAKRYWSALTDTPDEVGWEPRDDFIFPPPYLSFFRGAVHPVYQPLETLLENMAKQLRGDHEQVPDDSRKKDDYLHEVFQRLILNFLFTHDDKSFMTKQKGTVPRKPVEEPVMKASMSASQVSKIRNSNALSSRDVPSESAPSRTSRSSLKRKREGEAASDGGSDPKDGDYSDPKDGDYSDPKDGDYGVPVSTVSCVSILLFTSRLYTETSQMILTVMGKRYRNPFDRFMEHFLDS